VDPLLCPSACGQPFLFLRCSDARTPIAALPTCVSSLSEDFFMNSTTNSPECLPSEDAGTAPRRLRHLFVLLVALVALGSLPAATPVAADASTEIEGQADQISRLYRAALGRNADDAGHDYWVGRLENGEDVHTVAAHMMNSAEATARTNGDPLLDAYLWALGRRPDEAGYAYWSALDPVVAVVAISDSEEHQLVTATVAPPIPVPLAESIVQPEGWVDAGNGVFLPQILLDIRYCESKNNYLAANPRSTARGGYQFLRGSWAAYGHAARYGVGEAHLATPAQQDEAALLTWNQDGSRPWLASRHCWS
jgi:hypothetical protein